MNKIQKIVAVLGSVAMACAFATCAFAAPVQDVDSARSKINAYLAENGITGMDAVVNSLDGEQLATLRDNAGTLTSNVSAAKAAVENATSKTEVQAAVNNALDNVQGVLNKAGVTAVATVEASATEVVVTPAAASDKGVVGTTQAVVPLDKKGGSTSGSNGTTGSTGTAANPIAASSGSVIKPTGDNSAVALVAAVLGVSAVLGMAVRKENAQTL